MTWIGKLRKKLRDYGPRGLAGFIAHKLCGFPKEFVVFPPALDHPVRLRFGSTDTLVFDEVIVNRHYNFGLPSIWQHGHTGL
jgi:hypothetical protein